MAYWESPVEGSPPEHRDFAQVWQKAEKIVFSRTLTTASTRNTRVERDFDAEAIRELKRASADDISIGGTELAAIALEADLVDECHLFLNPVIVGGGKPAFRALRQNLELLETAGSAPGSFTCAIASSADEPAPTWKALRAEHEGVTRRMEELLDRSLR